MVKCVLHTTLLIAAFCALVIPASAKAKDPAAVRLVAMLTDGRLTTREKSEAVELLKHEKCYGMAVEFEPVVEKPVHGPSFSYISPIRYSLANADTLESIARTVERKQGRLLGITLWREPDADTARQAKSLAESAVQHIYNDVLAARGENPDLSSFDKEHVRFQDGGIWYSPNPRPGHSKLGAPTIGIWIRKIQLQPSQASHPRILLPKLNLEIGRLVAWSSSKPESAELNGVILQTILRRITALVEAEEALGGEPINEGLTGPVNINTTRELMERSAREARMHSSAVVKVVAENFLHAVQKQDWSTAAWLFCDDFQIRHGRDLFDGSLFRYDPHKGKNSQSVLGDPRATVIRVAVHGMRAEASIGVVGGDPYGQKVYFPLELVKEGAWKILSVPARPRRVGIPPVKSGDLRLEVVKMIPWDGTISADEPVVARLQLSNTTGHKVSISQSSLLSTRVEVYDKSGRLVGATPVEPLPADMFSSWQEIGAGETRVRWVVLSALYRFDRPGDYTVRIQMLKLDQERSAMAETDIGVHVLPRNSARLRSTCEQIFAPLRDFSRGHSIPRGLDSFPFRTRLQALYSIRSDEVLPFLRLVAREWDGSSEQWPAMQTMKRIGTLKAKALLSELARRSDHVGKVAGMVQKEPVGRGIDEWYVGDEWKAESSGAASSHILP